ncbi:MAG: hypothetical protein ACK2UC_08935 [Anaerolineae bacterium]|jgi:hypothetical protein
MAKRRMGLATAEPADDWLAILDAQAVEFLLLDAEQDANLLREVTGHPGWMVELQDGESVLLCRTPASADAHLAQKS